MPLRPVAHQFDDYAQQHEADTLGMWTFLLTEILLFGGLFLAYAVYRSLYPEAWAEGSRHQYLIAGTINTAVLLSSSLAVALAVHEAEEDRWRRVFWLLITTVVLGLGFLGVKFYEYYLHYVHHAVPGVRFAHGAHVALFYVFYYAMTGLHAVHMLVGLGVMITLAVLVRTGRLRKHVTIEMGGLYWHLVDIFWVFLYPLFYLVG